MIEELHKSDYVIYSIEHREPKNDPVLLRKIRKESVSLRKLLITSSFYTTPLVKWQNGNTTVLSLVDVKEVKASPKVKIEYSHNNTRTFLALKTFVFTDLLTNIEHEIEFSQVSQIIFSKEYFKEIDDRMETDSILF